MIFIVDKFSIDAFGLTTAVQEFSSVVPTAGLLARTADPQMVTKSDLHRVTIRATIFGNDKVWHLDDVFTPICLFMAAVGLLTGRDIILCPHGMFDGWALSNGKSKLKRSALGSLNWLAQFGRLHVHALNRAEGRKARVLLSNARSIEIVPNGVPSDILLYLEKSAESSACALDEKLVIGCMSRVTSKKNQLELVHLAARLREERPKLFQCAEFRIDGYIEEPTYAVRLEAEIVALGLEGKVVIGGPVAFDHRASCLSKYDIFFFPSKSEGMPYVVLEAMALGAVPLVASTASCGFVREFGGQVYQSLDHAVTLLPEDRIAFARYSLDREAFLGRYGKDRLSNFLNGI